MPRVDALALDRDEAGARVRRTDRELDFLARRVVALRERQLQLGVLFQGTRDVAFAGDLVVEARQLLALRIAHFVGEVAGRVGRERQVEAACGDRQRRLLERRLLAPRLVLVRAVRLAHEHRDVARLEPREHQLVDGCCACLRIDRDQAHAARAAARQILQIAVRLVADQVRHARHELRRFGGDAAAAIRLEALRHQVHAIRRACEALQVERERRVALCVRLRLGELLRVALARELRIVELCSPGTRGTKECSD